ncbi:PDZ domain-containing protein 4 [Microtus ochrogaster]|uniref:PDZ domain-containing protein 4 n=1 Tax=Microtus ochrogaster TaxID=79684 RepID=A0A8J6GYR8_MICOH|nr:PDZ domain-containing protein 4 [Microtus ochrogaster]
MAGSVRESESYRLIEWMSRTREEAVAILSQEENTISLPMARPVSQLAKRWEDSDRDDFLDDFWSVNEGDLRVWKLMSPPAPQAGNDEKGAPDEDPVLSYSLELDSGVVRTDENAHNEESCEHDLLGHGLCWLTGQGLGGADLPRLTDEDYERYRELLEIKFHLENVNQLRFFFRACSGNSSLNVNRKERLGHEMAILEEELRHLDFNCNNILLAQKRAKMTDMVGDENNISGATPKALQAKL